ncbi:hypothetical protein KSC_058450 [Ktedonobacter sp. SOSP1-52]|uniref:PadR family transcriptional regulator n=1 Tax=Ktedonobacter sp. SOSP1-52 TaxID=2778366 RepID=UPI001914EB08|nr:PadR family transcriptional regulator [Ktedonobacter sp. SOSP1-52]GHO66953.1 hypothetical protein KSC_058450 [Ktedonobacter sp. SOSP1-52]
MMSQQARLPIGYAQLASRILSCLEDAPKHTLDLLAELEQEILTLPEPGTFYRILASLEHQGWIEPLVLEQHLRPYALTPAGEDTLRQSRRSASFYNERIDAHPHDHQRKERYMRLNRTFLRLYPRAWRERYEEEMLAVLEQHTITPLTIFDLLLGAIDARLDPHYRSQRSAFSLQDVRLTTRAFIALLAVFTAALFIWQSLSIPYESIIGAYTATGVPIGSDSHALNRFPLIVAFKVADPNLWSDPGFMSNNIAVYALYIEFILLFVANIFFLTRILRSAPPTRRKLLLLGTLASVLLPLLVFPLLQSSPMAVLIPTNNEPFGPIRDIFSELSTVLVLEIACSGLFLGLIKGWQTIRARQKGLLTMVAVVVLLPALSFFLIRFFQNSADWVGSIYSPLQIFLYSFGACLLPFLGFGALLLAIETDELQKPFLRRVFRYASVVTITLIISLSGTVVWNIYTWTHMYNTPLGALFFKVMPQAQFFGSYGPLLFVSLSIFTLILLGGIGAMLKRGYRALSSPTSDNQQEQPPMIEQSQQF